jgi:hypothetical protein
LVQELGVQVREYGIPAVFQFGSGVVHGKYKSYSSKKGRKGDGKTYRDSNIMTVRMVGRFVVGERNSMAFLFSLFQ